MSTDNKPKEGNIPKMYIWGCVDWRCHRDNAENDLNLAFPTPHKALNDMNLDIKAVSSGNKHTIVRTADGKLYGFGNNSRGQLGINKDYTFAPVEIAPESAPWKQVSCGAFHTLALDSEGKVWSWGWNELGQLGNAPKSATGRSRPVRVRGPLDVVDIKYVCAGGQNSYAVSTEGDLYCWGSIRYGALGVGHDGVTIGEPGKSGKEMTADREKPEVQHWFKENNYKIEQVAAGDKHVLVLTEDKRLFTFGCGGFGRLGQGIDAHDKLAPVEVKWYSKRELVNEGILCGSEHSVAVAKLKEGAHKFVYYWGRQGFDLDGVMGPTTVDDLCGQPLKKISAGLGMTMVCTEEGQVAIWGENKVASQLGLYGKMKSKKKEPQVIRLLEDKHVIDVSVGGWHEIAMIDTAKSKGPLDLKVPEKGRHYVLGGKEIIPKRSWEDSVILFNKLSSGEAVPEQEKESSSLSPKKGKKNTRGTTDTVEQPAKKKAKTKGKKKIPELPDNTKIKVWMEDEYIPGTILSKKKGKNKFLVTWERKGWKDEVVQLNPADFTDDEDNIERWQLREE